MNTENEEIIRLVLRNAARTISELLGRPVKIQFVEESQRQKKVTVNQIMTTICDVFGVTMYQVCGKSRKKAFVLARKAYTHMVYERELGTFAAIGMALGGRDHSCAIHYRNEAVELLAANDTFQSLYWCAKDQIDGVHPVTHVKQEERPVLITEPEKPKCIRSKEKKAVIKQVRQPGEKPAISFGYGSNKFLNSDKPPGTDHSLKERHGHTVRKSTHAGKYYQ